MTHNSYMAETPVFRPTKEEFSKPFSEYVNKILKKNPDIPMFKVVPPAGWKPRRAAFPRLHKLDIQCPIKQMAFGTKGTYRCILMEQKSLTAERFKEIAEDADHAPPKKMRETDDGLLERAFWSSVTINPPLYGADTPMSLFDEKLSYGWNLRHLEGCLLKRPDVPQVPGVTTPMTYFGMWKSFFAWHVEDADLFSINYLHFGAPKVWYCVSPSNRAKFERMCQSIFPELHKGCRAFLRHKDILLSPNLLRTYNIEYMQAKQEPNEFIVLNAAAYHAGYNMGFNCAEAVNFATKAWIDVGRHVVRCKCRDDGVRLSMRLFGCSSGSSASSDEEDLASDSRDDSSEDEPSEDEVDSKEAEEEEEEDQQQQQEGDDGAEPRRASSRKPRTSKDGTPDAKGAKRAAAAAAAADTPSSKRSKVAADALSPASPRSAPRKTRTSLAAAAAAKRMRTTHATAEARARLAVRHGKAAQRRSGDGSSSKAKPSRGIRTLEHLEDSLQRAAAAAAAIRARAAAKQQHSEDDSDTAVEEEQQPPLAAAAVAAAPDAAEPSAADAAAAVEQQLQEQQPEQQQRSQSGLTAAVKAEDATTAAAAAAGDAAAAEAAADAAAAADADAAADAGLEESQELLYPDSPTATKARFSTGCQIKLELPAVEAATEGAIDSGFGRNGSAARGSSGRGTGGAAAAAVAAESLPTGEPPQVIIGEDHGSKYFYMVQVLRDQKPKRRGHLVMRWLKEGKDGLFRPSTDAWEEPASTLVGVRTQWVPPHNGRPGGYRLLTLRSRILETELTD